jgi:hypothetical protein
MTLPRRIPSTGEECLHAGVASSARQLEQLQFRRDLADFARETRAEFEALLDLGGWPWAPGLSLALDACVIIEAIGEARPGGRAGA